MSFPLRLWRERAHEQFEDILGAIETDWKTECDQSTQAAASQARNVIAETLNQGLRRIRQTQALEDAASVSAEVTSSFAGRCAIFRFGEGQASALAARGLGRLPLVFPPDSGAAFRSCIETQDPVIAMATPSEISQELADRVGDGSTERAFLWPIAVHNKVLFVLFAAGSVQPAPMELIAGITAVHMETISPASLPKREDLVAIQGVQPAKANQAAPQSWEELPPALQALHLKAQREARLRVAEMRLEHGAALREGLGRSDIYSALRGQIDAARETFRNDYIGASPSMVDYLYLELVRGLAQENDRLLGPAFPGPLV